MSTRTGKTLLAIALLISGVKEAFNMWHQTRSLPSLIIVGCILLALCGLLLRSAFRKPDPVVASSKGRKIFWTIIGVFSAMSILGQMLALGKPAEHGMIIDPLDTRTWISMGIEAAAQNPATREFNMGVLQT